MFAVVLQRQLVEAFLLRIITDRDGSISIVFDNWLVYVTTRHFYVS